MNYILSQADIFIDNRFVKSDICVSDGRVISFSPSFNSPSGLSALNYNNCIIIPGLLDVHVHLREPGFSYKETIETGSLAAAHGGFTSVCCMPNLKPCPDSVEKLKKETDIINNTAKVNVYPYGTISVNEEGKALSDMEGMCGNVVAFSDDGRGVQSDDFMREAMLKAKSLNKIIAAHCEDNSLLDGGYIHKGEYASLHNHRGISSESEYKQIERDLNLAYETGCKYHVCHISTKESVEVIRQAKKSGVDVTCETAPHYLIFNDMDLQEDGRFKMNPPIRSESDRLALIDGILDGTIDMIATDHAPHSKEEKSKGLKDSLMGVVGLETSFSAVYTHLVKTNIITLEKQLELMQTNPRKRFGIGTELKVGEKADLTVFNLNEEYTVNPNEFLTMGRATPFEGMKMFGVCKMTMVNGRIVWQENLTEK
ncbi:MAG: dihydroorotase [Ruminococcaceae bacterium]|jgi:dihydroorotase|nr:dihydroorotase [Oscillospiraceae bacterium]